jgi:lipopolysaccharide transport system ATP-binding protein
MIQSPPKTSGLQIQSLCFRDANGQPLKTLITGQAATLWVRGIAHETTLAVSLSLLIKSLSEENSCVLALKSETDQQLFDLSPGEFTLKFQMPYCGLRAGSYAVKVGLHNGRYFNVLDIVESYLFTVQSSSDMNRCLFYQPRTWTL